MSLNTGERGDLAPQAQPLGAPIRKPSAAPVAQREISPGIWRAADGSLSTNIPPPAAPVPACSTCIDVRTSMQHHPCRSCAYPDRPHWWPASKGARP